MNGNVVGISALVMWSVLPVLVAFTGNVPPIFLSGLVHFIGFLTCLSFQIVKKDNIFSYWRRPLADYAFWIVGAGIYTLLMLVAMKMIPIFEALILNYLWPLLLVLFSFFIQKNKISGTDVAGMAIGFIGIAVLFFPSHDHLFADFTIGHAIAIFAATLWALYSVLAKKKSYPAGFFAPLFLIFSLICFALHFVYEPTIMPIGIEWIAVILLGIFRVSYICWDYAMRHGNVIFLASLSYFLPLISSLFLVMMNLGPHKPGVALGAALIIAGCLIVNFQHIRKLIRIA